MGMLRKIESEIKVWIKKEKDEEGDAITSMYLDEGCQNYFGHYHNRDAKKNNFIHISRKDVGTMPMTMKLSAGHDRYCPKCGKECLNGTCFTCHDHNL